MKRRSFIKKTAVTSALTAGMVNLNQAQMPAEMEYYEYRTYTLKFGSSRRPLDTYLEQALIPALNRQGVKQVGVFEELHAPQPSLIHLVIPYPSLQHFIDSQQKLDADATYQAAGKSYDEVENPIYLRYDTSMLRAFSGIPQMKVPPQESELFELRIYESFSEDAARRKVEMFNEGELDIFYKVKLNPVFFGSCVAGKDMPHLTYMLHFKDMEERDANWKAFIDHPDWKAMSGMEKYTNTVSNIIRRFLVRASYSQI